MAGPSLLSEYSRNCSLPEDFEQISLEWWKVIGFAQSRDYFVAMHYYATRFTIEFMKTTPGFRRISGKKRYAYNGKIRTCLHVFSRQLTCIFCEL